MEIKSPEEDKNYQQIIIVIGLTKSVLKNVSY